MAEILPVVITVPEASGRVIVRRPEVEAPVILKLLVAGVPEEPARYRSFQGKVAEPKSMVPAAFGSSAVLMATEARFDRAVVA